MREVGKTGAAPAQGGRRIPVVRFGDPKRPLRLDQADIGNPDRPICFGPFAIGCYVLSNGARILEHEGVTRALGLGRCDPAAARGSMLEVLGYCPSESTELRDWEALLAPVPFDRSARGRRMYGWDPDTVQAFCSAAGSLLMEEGLSRRILTIVERCSVLSLVFDRYAEVLGQIDEVTGYARYQQRIVAAQLLEPLVRASTRPWLRALPTEFFEELCRLCGQTFRPFLHLPTQAACLIDDVLGGWPLAGDEIGTGGSAFRDDDELTWRGPDQLRGVAKIRMTEMLTVMRVSDDWQSFSRLWERSGDRAAETSVSVL